MRSTAFLVGGRTDNMYRRAVVEDGGSLDDWGDLDQFNGQGSRGVLRHMTEDEEAAGLSWDKFRPE